MLQSGAQLQSDADLPSGAVLIDQFDRYAAWIDRRRRAVVAGAGLAALVGLVLALTLPVRTDLANLLPAHQRSVRDLERIQGRTAALGLVLCAVASDDPGRRAAATQDLAQRIRGLDRSLVADVVVDDGLARSFVAQHRFLFAPLDDLEAARDVLAERLRRAKLKANPLYVPLDDPADLAREEAAEQTVIDRLRARLDAAQGQQLRSHAMVSSDGRTQVVIVQAA
ncbi:MAG: hypothetical protein ABUS79_30465, partial [Pseudomonadota bacterium]